MDKEELITSESLLACSLCETELDPAEELPMLTEAAKLDESGVSLEFLSTIINKMLATAKKKIITAISRFRIFVGFFITNPFCLRHTANTVLYTPGTLQHVDKI